MGLIQKKLASDREDARELIKEINGKNFFERCSFMVFGIFLYAVSFSIFFSPYNIVMGGTTGLSMLMNDMFGIDSATFVLTTSVILLILSYLFLGTKQTVGSIAGSLLLPFFMKATAGLVLYIDLGESSLVLISIFGGLLSGLSSGIILKNGFSTGGAHVLYQIMSKYCKIGVGQASLIVNSVIIAASAYLFGFPSMVYAIIGLVISSVVTDRVLLGVSNQKSFHIITDKPEEVKTFVLKELGHGITEMDARGGFENKKKKMLFCTVPTNKYYVVKSQIELIDKNAFFLITDAYEVSGGA